MIHQEKSGVLANDVLRMRLLCYSLSTIVTRRLPAREAGTYKLKRSYVRSLFRTVSCYGILCGLLRLKVSL